MAESALSWQSLATAFFGGAIALAGQTLFLRHASAKTAQRLAAAFWEELSAAYFYNDGSYRGFTGFSSQVFDSLFKETAEAFPDSLARDVMRYHWRMKFLHADQARNELGHPANQGFVTEAEQLRARLLLRLDHYSKREAQDLVLDPAETCDSTLLISI